MTRTSNVLELPAARLPVAMQTLAELGLDANTWRVLTESIFPGAKTADGILLAVRYCKARGLDPLKRPVHVVPMWSKTAGREIETVWPGIAEVQTTAARTGQWAGMDPPRFGPDRTRTFQGRVKTDKGWDPVEITLTFPEWCEVTVYRLVGGVRCAFTEPVFWEEAYSRSSSRSELPTDMWAKRPRGQLHKCAKAASLRAAFPEEATYTAEEMAGKVIESDAVGLAPPTTTPAREPIPKTETSTAVSLAATAPTAAPDSSDQSSVIDEAVREQVARVVARARAANAWKQAEEYCLARFNGPHLAHALGALREAQSAA
jgi:phage recombination protein Bet